MRWLAQTMAHLEVIAVVVSIALVIIMTRDMPPWRQKYPKPRKQVTIAKDQIAAYRIREQCPRAFDPHDPLYQPIQPPRLAPEDVAAIADAVIDRQRPKPEP